MAPRNGFYHRLPAFKRENSALSKVSLDTLPNHNENYTTNEQKSKNR